MADTIIFDSRCPACRGPCYWHPQGLDKCHCPDCGLDWIAGQPHSCQQFARLRNGGYRCWDCHKPANGEQVNRLEKERNANDS